jgi:hypothetical protein
MTIIVARNYLEAAARKAVAMCPGPTLRLVRRQ